MNSSKKSGEIKLFTFPITNQTIRIVIGKNGKPVWVGMDVCEVLGLDNVSQALSRLDDDEKADIIITDTSSNGVSQRRNVSAVTESGLYALIFTSRKPVARAFRKWTTSEVLPAIRETGKYDGGFLGQQAKPEPVVAHDNSFIQIDPLVVERIKKEEDLVKYTNSIISIRMAALLGKKSPERLMDDAVTMAARALNDPSMIDVFRGLIPYEDRKDFRLSATEIADAVGDGWQNYHINNLIANHPDLGWQVKINGVWRITEAGQKYGVIGLRRGNSLNTEKWAKEYDTQLWTTEALDIIARVCNSTSPARYTHYKAQ